MRERRRPPVARTRDVYTEADGLFGRITDLVIENPARSGGFVMIVMVVGAIVSNAAFFQTAHHPDPLFVTRMSLPEPAVPLPKGRPAAGSPASADHASASVEPPPLPVPATDAALVSETQKALAALKLYDGPVDGVPGPQTRAAISAFETRIGLVPTGQPSARLLAQIRAKTQPPRAATDPAPTGSVPDPAVTARTRRVQSALNDIGYGPVPVDGRFGEKTANAIRRFELDNGLAVTGESNDALFTKLVKIGALKPL